ncbi:hypothetical protein BX600DRAFT_472277 [Xylariales sp. PMI_506]|nr:hypothetical protein BX600DRAFT_472277 [Xylariales sp. PMI_506]
MLVTLHPVAVAVWLFFPLWVAAVRYVVNLIVVKSMASPEAYHLESDWRALVGVYIVPFAWSLVAHGMLIWNLFSPEDRKEMTRTTIKFIEIDVAIIGVTVAYWILVEAGFLVTLLYIGLSVVLGPGASLCVAWFLREKVIENYSDGVDDDTERQRDGDGETAPLLQ